MDGLTYDLLYIRKGTIHVSMNKINFYQTIADLLSINVVVSILVLVY